MTTMAINKVDNIISQFRLLPDSGKDLFMRKLRKELLHTKFIQLLDEFRTDEISLKELDAEVEEVRKERYAKKLSLEGNY